MSTGIVLIFDRESVFTIYPFKIACNIVIGVIIGAISTLSIDFSNSYFLYDVYFSSSSILKGGLCFS